MGSVQSKDERVIRENNRMLDNVKRVGLECDDMANDIKFNLSKQTDQMQNSVLKNLYSIQGETNVANRVLNLIKKERTKNRIVYYSVLAMIALAILFVLYKLIF